MPKFQVWMRDEYGQQSILHSTDDLDDAFKEAKKRVTDINVNNSLTMDDRERNWEAYLPILVSENKTANKKKHFVYGGKGPLNRDMLFTVDKKTGKVEAVSIGDIPKPKLRFYLGDVSVKRGEEKDWFASDLRKRELTTFDAQDLQGKSMFFIKKV